MEQLIELIQPFEIYEIPFHIVSNAIFIRAHELAISFCIPPPGVVGRREPNLNFFSIQNFFSILNFFSEIEPIRSPASPLSA